MDSGICSIIHYILYFMLEAEWESPIIFFLISMYLAKTFDSEVRHGNSRDSGQILVHDSGPEIQVARNAHALRFSFQPLIIICEQKMSYSSVSFVLFHSIHRSEQLGSHLLRFYCHLCNLVR